jgi:3-(3-hydroxy-phenyl)propionate hydroxylase
MKYDVLIVGYSMLGNVAALLLANIGLSVVVVEKKELSDILLAKSARIDDEVMLVFEKLGLIDEIKSIMYPLKGTQVIDKKDRVLLEFNQETKSQFAPLYGFYQPDLQKILQRKAARHKNITVLSGCEVETFEQNDEKVDVYVSKAGSHDYKSISASHLLVCNGQYSHISDFLDIEIEDFNYRSAILCVDTISKENASLHPYAQTIYNGEFPVIRIINDAKHQRWEFQIGEEKVHEPKTSEKVRNLLTELSDLELKVESAFVYNFESKILNKWRVNRVLIAGDAAHVMPPYLGMGLAAGIKDINNLAWKLKMLKDGLVSPDILDTYQEERLQNVRYLIQLNLWIKRLFKSSKLSWIKGFVPIIPKWFLKRTLDTGNQLKSGIIDTKLKGAGIPIVSSKVANCKGEIVSFNTLLSHKFVVLSLATNPVDALFPSQLEFLATLGTQFIQLTKSGQKFVQSNRYAEDVYDKEGKLQEWMKEQKSQFVILRPDRIVYGFCANSSQLNNSISRLMLKLPINVR